ncbi:transcription factor Spi-B isoform 3-T3 [Glossophaga mutica]
MESSTTWTAASTPATLTQKGPLTPCGAGLRPRLSLPPPTKSSTQLWSPSATPRMSSSVMDPPRPTPLWGALTPPPAWRPRGPASQRTPRRTFPARPWAPRPTPHTPAPCCQKRRTSCWTVPPWRSRTASRMKPSWLALRGGVLRGPQEAAPVPVPAGAVDSRRHARVRVVGGARCRGLPVLLQAQGAPGAPLGPAEGQPQAHDLPEAGPRPAQLRQDRRDPQGQAQAHLPV